MAVSERVRRHLRQHIVGYLALFIALSGTSYAANKIKSNQIARNAITSKLIKDGQVTSADVADNGLTGADIDESSLSVLLADGSVTTQKLADLAVTLPKLAFDPATQAELNAYSAQLSTPGTINDPSNPVQFSKLRGVPPGFADGTDDTGGAPGLDSLGQAEPGSAVDDEIRDGAIDSEDLTNATIVNGDVSATAAIADTKLGTIATAGKVADSALSSNVALLNLAQTFSANKTFNGTGTFNTDVDMNLGAGENLSLSASRATTDAVVPLSLSYANNTTSGSQNAATVINQAGTGTTENLIHLSQLDTDTAVANGIDLNVGAGGVTTALEMSDPEIVTALDVGSNDIKTSGATISSTELEKLDGSPQRTVSIPLGSFLDITDSATIDFGGAADGAPDFQSVNSAAVLAYDVTAGSPDINAIASTFTVPEDYASGDTIVIRASKSGHSGVAERLACGDSINGATGGGLTGTAITSTSANTKYSLSLGSAYAPGDSVGLACKVDDGAGGATHNDLVRITSIAFVYTATR